MVVIFIRNIWYAHVLIFLILPRVAKHTTSPRCSGTTSHHSCMTETTQHSHTPACTSLSLHLMILFNTNRDLPSTLQALHRHIARPGTVLRTWHEPCPVWHTQGASHGQVQCDGVVCTSWLSEWACNGHWKVIWACFKRKLKKEIKVSRPLPAFKAINSIIPHVAQPVSNILKHALYHHGELSQTMTTINLAHWY